MRFTKVNTVNLFLTLHVLRITDDHFILPRISMLEINKIGLEYSTDHRLASKEPANKKRLVEEIIK